MPILLFKATASEDDFEAFYQMKSDPLGVYWSGYKKPPDKKGLNQWYLNQLINTDRDFYLARESSDLNTYVGFMYLDKHENGKIREVTYGVHSSHTGKGIASTL